MIAARQRRNPRCGGIAGGARREGVTLRHHEIDGVRVKRKLEEDPEPTDLLRIFGRRGVSSPAFELVPA